MSIESDIILEEASAAEKAKALGYTVDANVSNDGFVMLSGYDNLDYKTFKKKFIEDEKAIAAKEYGRHMVVIHLGDDPGFKDKPEPADDRRIIRHVLTLFRRNSKELKESLPNTYFIFINNRDEYFVVNTTEYKSSDIVDIVANVETLCATTGGARNATGVNDKKPAKTHTDELKDDIVATVAAAAEEAETEEEAIEILDKDDELKLKIAELEESDYGRPKFSNSRTARLTKVDEDFNNTVIHGKSVSDIMDGKGKPKELPSTSLPVSSPNEEWEDMKFINFNKLYDLDKDIVAIFKSFANKEYPVVVRNLNAEDTSTSQDYIETYTAEMEDSEGKRFSLKVDIPKFIDDRFLMLRGNKKVIAGQLVNLPCTKTDEDTVQLVSNYNKIFIYRYGSDGKSYSTVSRLLKALNKYTGKKIDISFGDNAKVAAKYNVPIDYRDLCANLDHIKYNGVTMFFNQDLYYSKYNTNRDNGVPYGVDKAGNVMYYTDNLIPISTVIANLLKADEEFNEIYNSQKPASKHMYSRARIMNGFIPLIVLICNRISFNEFLNRAKIDYRIEEKRVRYDPDYEGIIKFANGYLIYKLDYNSSMLMNGLLECNTDMINVEDMNKKRTWVDFLEGFGGRILSDGIENFSELFMDPITIEVCEHCKLPTDYIDLLLLTNRLLSDTKYIKHTDITGNRYRTNEIVAGHLYKALATSYGEYRSQLRRGRGKIAMTIKRSAVIDDIMKNPVTSDLSIMTPLVEVESNYSASFKGLSGLNADRAYGLDKRGYDPSMIGKLSLSTGFSDNIGVGRQTTMDMDIEGSRGYIKNSNPDEVDFTKRLGVTEGMTPFGSTRDDPIRTAMTQTQTAKHAMPTNKAAPLLITNGTDEAMVYMTSDEYAFKAKKKGTVKEVVPNEYMILSYEDGTGEYISLKEETRKNSDGGFYITITLVPKLKKGAKFKAGDIVAHDAKTFSNKLGESENLAYNVGVLCKVGILPTDEGFEDSASISSWLSEAMGTTVATKIPVAIGANTNVFDMVSVGSPVEEGQPLITMQDSIDDKDAAILLHNITDSDYVSDLGRVRIKSKYTGVLQEIKIYRTCEISELSESLQKVVKVYEKGIKATKNLYKENNISGSNTLDPDYALTNTGKLKNIGEGVLIEFFIKYFDNMSIGDKLTLQSANKGVIKYIFPKGKEPFTDFRPEETVHIMASSRSFNARMVTSPIISGALNKGLIELDRSIKDIMGLPFTTIELLQ